MTEYSVMSKKKAASVSDELVSGVRLSVSGSKLIAKMAPGQTVSGVVNINRDDARALMLTPAWASEEE
jgi:hypothetical protein|tara:strand:- start:602 stop:805 length:204 start_codon:yes stop_codon:yes gene_type:complete